uniref:Transmembrane protein n=1 Tax=Nelumbo nucifera TaxID=4432 RepID=A0A822XS94_NELNU|nr:TPA_asm: hypothetical protein HUJ06_024335 [Nelumbo nucifera]
MAHSLRLEKRDNKVIKQQERIQKLFWRNIILFSVFSFFFARRVWLLCGRDFLEARRRKEGKVSSFVRLRASSGKGRM